MGYLFRTVVRLRGNDGVWDGGFGGFDSGEAQRFCETPPPPQPPPRWGAGEGVSAFQAAFKIAWKGSLKASGVSFGKAEAHEGSLKAVLNGFQKAACVAQQSCEAKNVS